MAVFGLVFSKLAMLVISPDPLPFCKDTPANIKGGRFLLFFVFAVVFYGLRRCVEMLKLNRQHLLKGCSSSFCPVLSEYMKIIAIFYYPVLYYPLLVCNTLQHKAGYVFGTLLSFSHLTVLVWQKFDCPKTPEVRRLHGHVSC